MHKKKNYILAAVFIFSFISIFGCHPQEEKQKPAQIIPVLVSRVKLQEVGETLEYVGDISAEDEAAVYPKVSGKVIAKVKEDGQSVEKGQAIAYIDRDEVGLKFEKAPVESPLTGIVGRVYANIGQSVTPQTAIALVVNMDRVKVNLDIPERYLAKISLGQEVNISIDAYPGEFFTGSVTKISPVVDLGTRSAPIEVTVDNPGHKLKSGMFARTRLALGERRQSPVILKEAIIGKQPDAFVYVAENNKAVLKKISLGIRQGPYYEVEEGLKDGDLVVIMGQNKLYDGAQVIVEEAKE